MEKLMNLESTIEYVEKTNIQTFSKSQVLFLLKTMNAINDYEVENIFQGTKDVIRHELNQLPEQTKRNFATILTYIDSKIDSMDFEDYKEQLLSIS